MEVDLILALSPIVVHEIRSVTILWKKYSLQAKDRRNNKSKIEKEVYIYMYI